MHTLRNNFKKRLAERNAICRCCRTAIKVGEEMITGFSSANSGMYMHFHVSCVKEMAKL